MTEPNPTPTTDAPATETPEATAPAQPEPDWRAEAEKWKALSRKNEERATANADKARRFDEVEESQKTELQKAIDRATAAETLAAEVSQRALRAEVAAAKGVPATLLSGTTEEELTASADALLEFRGPATPVAPAAPAASGIDGTAATGQARTYTRSQIGDPKFFAEHRVDILAAAREGRIAG